MIGPVIKRYGPFRLHRYAVALKGGRLLDFSRYYVVLGELAVPLYLPLRLGRADPRGYSRVVNDSTGPFRDCIYMGEIPMTRNTLPDFQDHVERWLKNDQSGTDWFYEQLATGDGAAASNSRREKLYRDIIMRNEARYQVVSDAFRDFLTQYPDAAVATKRDSASDEREIRRIRRQLRRAYGLYWLLNRKSQ